MNQKGASLLELIIYIALLSIIAMVLVNIFYVSLKSRAISKAKFEVNQNLRFATERVRQLIYDADSISTLGTCPFNTLIIVDGSASSSVYIENGRLKVDDGLKIEELTNSKVIATSTGECLFKIISNPLPAKSTLQMKIKIVYNDSSNQGLDFSQSTQMTVSLR